jgi:hypothetical protein
VKVDEKTFSFTLLVPPGAWAKIESGFGHRFGDCEVRQLFEARIKQHIESGNLQDIPAGRKVDLGCLHELEVDGLFSDIRRENLLSLL